MSKKPKTVVVISDTHVNRLKELPPNLLDILAMADVIIHLGDYVSPELLKDLRKLGNFHGIIGNHDGKIDRRELKVMDVLEINGKRLGLMHGLFIPIARPKRMKALFRKHRIDILLCGHNHLATCKMLDGILLFNPGTVTRQFPATQGSYGIITLGADGSISKEIVPLENSTPNSDKFLVKLCGIIIRNGIRWLEAWPYIDLHGQWDRTDLALKRLITTSRTFLSRQKESP